MRRMVRWLGWILAVSVGVPVLLVLVLLAVGNTSPGRQLIERLTPALTGDTVRISGLSGRFPDRLRASRVELTDPKGAWIALDTVVLDWSPLRLLDRVVDIDRLEVAATEFARMPVSSSSSSDGLPVQVVVRELRVRRLSVAAAVAGQSAVLTVHGSGALQSLEQGDVHMAARRLDGDGEYSLDATVTAQRVQATAKAAEAAHGLIAELAGLPDLGKIDADATLDGPHKAVVTHLVINAGPLRARADGTLDLADDAADMTIAAVAPAMTPRPDVSWQRLNVGARMQGPFDRPNVTARMQVERLRAVGASVGRLDADVEGNFGQIHLHASANELTLPGQDPTLFAAAPVTLDATVRLDAPGRPISFALRHPLLTADGSGQLENPLRMHVACVLPDIMPIAALSGANLQGHTALTLNVAQRDGTTDIDLDGTIGITGGIAQAQALLGDAAHLEMAASVTGRDARLSSLHVNGRSADVWASGSLINNIADLHWALRIDDLAAVQPTLTGQLAAQGQVSGPEDDLSARATISGDVSAQGVQSGPVSVQLLASGLPGNPQANLTATGALLGAPVDLGLSVERANGVLHVAVQRGDWKSLHLEGAITLPAGAPVPEGRMTLRMARLADLAPLLGVPVDGRIEASLDANENAAKLMMLAQGAALPGTGSVSRAALNATVANPASHPVVDASLALDGASIAGIGGNARLEAHGPADAMILRLTADVPQLPGAPARLSAAAVADAFKRSVALNSLDLDWRQHALRLLSPARFLLADRLSIEHLRLGLQQAVLEVDGRVSPRLDLTASLSGLPADLAAAADPTLAVSGTISANARLSGTVSRPNGTLRVTASAIRVRNGPGEGMPPANLTITGALAGSETQLDARLTAGALHATLNGKVPLADKGVLELRGAGVLDLAMLDPVLAAQGRRMRGRVSLNATIGGTIAAPQVAGSARLTNGEVQDYTQGIHITDISAVLQADGRTVHLTQFTGRAGEGTIGGSGTIDLSPSIHMNLTFTAENARLLASDMLTAVIDARLSVQGDVEGSLALAGNVTVRRAEVRIPDKLPNSVVTIPVRNVNMPASNANSAAASADVTLDLTLDAPQQVFVRGRGLDAELGGSVHFGGTLGRIRPSGGLQLRRGTLSLAGQTLNFTEGSISFTGVGLTDPAIHFVATASTNNVVATLTVGGSARDPKITLSSVPDLPQDEILAQLLFHQSTSKLSPFQLASIAAALASLTGATSGIGDPLAGLRNTLGLDELSVGSGAKGAPTLQAGRYLAPGVYLGAKQNATGNGTQATVQIDIAKGLKLETSAGTGSTSATGASSTGQGASVGLTYQFEY